MSTKREFEGSDVKMAMTEPNKKPRALQHSQSEDKLKELETLVRVLKAENKTIKYQANWFKYEITTFKALNKRFWLIMLQPAVFSKFDRIITPDTPWAYLILVVFPGAATKETHKRILLMNGVKEGSLDADMLRDLARKPIWEENGEEDHLKHMWYIDRQLKLAQSLRLLAGHVDFSLLGVFGQMEFNREPNLLDFVEEVEIAKKNAMLIRIDNIAYEVAQHELRDMSVNNAAITYSNLIYESDWMCNIGVHTCFSRTITAILGAQGGLMNWKLSDIRDENHREIIRVQRKRMRKVK